MIDNRPLESWFFYAFASLTLVGAILTISLRNPVHCAIGLLLALLGTGGIFLGNGAEFLLAVQLIVYAGGVILLFLFVIMLVNLDRLGGIRRFGKWRWLGVGAAALTGIELVVLLHAPALPPMRAPLTGGNSEAVATTLLTEYLVPFEAISLLLLAALIGAVSFARAES